MERLGISTLPCRIFFHVADCAKSPVSLDRGVGSFVILISAIFVLGNTIDTPGRLTFVLFAFQFLTSTIIVVVGGEIQPSILPGDGVGGADRS